MDKKIFSISMVKNESDVIESFVRYNSNVMDGMIILDNGSTDDTLKILKQLKEEGLALTIFEDTNREHEQATKLSKLLIKAVDEFHADIIVPLDADEFLISSNQGNPRKILEKIESPTFYLVKWKTFVPDFSKNQKFIPARITTARDNSNEMCKVIIPKELVKNYEVKLTFGNHNLVFDPKYNDVINSVINDDLRIAHFPIRSKEQLISKVAVGWIYTLSRFGRPEGQNFHWQIMFNKLKENKEIVNQDLIDFAKKYSVQNPEKEINLKEEPIDLSFCKNTEIKYTPNKVWLIPNILESYEWLTLSFLNSKKESVKEEERLKSEITDLSRKMDELYESKILEKKYLQNKIEEYENSTSWKITSPLRKITSSIRKLFN
jgi:glycosyltransferase involved in cell wall biosynthesis